MNEFYIYAHINPINKEMFYIGKGKGYRMFHKSRSKYWKNIVNKYGCIYIKIIENLSESDAVKLEKFFIKHIGRKDKKEGNLVNMTDGGEGMSGYKHTDEYKENLKKRNLGNKNMLGKTISEEGKERIRKSKIGIPRSEETKKRIRDSRVGKYSGDNHPLFGKESKRKGRTKHNICLILELHNRGLSNPEIGKKLNINRSTIHKLIKNFKNFKKNGN